MPPAQAGKPFIIAVGGSPFAVGLDGQRGESDIGNQIARGRERLAQVGENMPVAGTRNNNASIRLLANLPHEIKRGTNRTRRGEYARMSHNSKETTQHMVAYAVRLAALHDSLQPLPVRA